MDWTPDIFGVDWPLKVAAAVADSKTLVQIFQIGCFLGPASPGLYAASVALFPGAFLLYSAIAKLGALHAPKVVPPFALCNGLTFLSQVAFINLVVTAVRPLQPYVFEARMAARLPNFKNVLKDIF